MHVLMDDFVDSFRDHGFSYPKYKAAHSDHDDIEWDIEEHEDDWEDFEDFWYDDHYENADFSIEDELIRFKHEDT